jgi:Protein of unknown function (DUF1822)
LFQHLVVFINVVAENLRQNLKQIYRARFIDRQSIMNTNIDPFIVTIPLTLSAHTQANLFRCHHTQRDRAKQVYLNALAVYATNYYLQCLGFETDLQRSDSWHPTMQALMDVADLIVRNCGKLECRPILSGAKFLSVPAEVWTDRIGYVAVQFDESLRTATLLGYIDRVGESNLALDRLRSLDTLPEYLNRLRQSEPVRETVNLSQWLENIFAAGWQAVEDLFVSPEPVLNFRGGDRASGERFEQSDLAVSRSKILDLKPAGESVTLAIGLMPLSDREQEIWVKLSPSGAQTHLPPNLELMVLDETGEVVMQAQARSTESILLKFSGETGEHFSLKIVLDDITLSESFVI